MGKNLFRRLFFCWILLACFAGCNPQSALPAESRFSLCKDGHDLEEVALVPASCSEDGVAAHTRCLRCGELFDEDGKRSSLDSLTLPASHRFENGICAVCGASQEETACKHSGGTATCLEKAICEKCGQPYGRPAGHTKVQVAEERFLESEATCTKRASYHASCALCGFVYAETFTVGEPLGHEGTATCQSKAVCTRCGQTFGSLGEHDFSLEIASDATLASVATCSAAATYYKSCALCLKVGDKTFSVGGPNAALHTFVADNVLTTDATHTRVCSSCSAAVTEPHVGSSTSCSVPAVCPICGRSFVPPDSHRFIVENPSPIYLASPATDESPATYYYSCLYCEKPGTNTFIGD